MAPLAAILPSVLAAVIGAAGTAVTAATAGGGERERDKEPSSDLYQGTSKDLVQALPPPKAQDNRASPMALGNDTANDLASGLTGAGGPEAQPEQLFGTLGQGLTSPQGGFLARATALQSTLNPTPTLQVPSSSLSIRKKQLGY